MRPETPAEAIAYSEHRRLHPTHDGFGCCSFWETELADADELLEDLRALGWHLAPDVSLPESVPAGDPKTAAKEIDNLPDRSFAVWQLVSMEGERGLTSVELNERYQRFSLSTPGVYPPMKQDSPRKRLPELARAGHLIRTERVRDGARVWVSASDEMRRTVAA